MSWTYRCLSRACRQEFDVSKPAKRCPMCGSAKLRWIPRKVSIAASSPGVDKELRIIADNYGLSDLRSARVGEPAVPKRFNTPTHGAASADLSAIGIGAQMNFPMGADGKLAPVAGWLPEPTVVAPGNSDAFIRGAPNPQSATGIEARETRPLPR